MANSRLCSIPDCGKKLLAKGLCRAHYARNSRYGDPLGGRYKKGDLLRFIHEVALHHNSEECLHWPFTTVTGYGQLLVGGKPTLAHRYVCTLIHGEPPTPDHEAAHSCGKGHLACVAPSHLSWKTRTENQADRLVHGTHNRGERCPHSKLTEAQVKTILSLRGKVAVKEIAAKFGVGPSAICEIHKRRNWAWVEIP